MNAVVDQALVLWGMPDAHYELVAARENAVFKVTEGQNIYAMRLHRQGYRSNAELRSELAWMAAVAEGGLAVPGPILSVSSDFLHVVGNTQVDALQWLSGTQMGKIGTPLFAADRIGLFRAIGKNMANLHEISDTWTPPTGFIRCAWDRAGLVGAAPLWDRFWDNPALSAEDRQLFQNLRDRADAVLARLEGHLDYGLIHADLVRENILVVADQVQFIDFDDGGFGYRLFDIATALLKNRDEPDYPALRDALIEGYLRVRSLDLGALDLFMALRAATYVGWNISRIAEAGGHARNDRFITTARDLAKDYLES